MKWQPGRLSQSSNTKFNFEDNPVGKFLERWSSLNMMGFFDLHTLFYYPNINLTSFDLFSRNTGYVESVVNRNQKHL